VPASLTGRIVGAFALLAIALWLAIGATMFVVLRGLHADATSSSLADIAQTFAVRIRAAAVDREVRQVVNQIRNEVAGSGVTIQLLASDGTTVEIGATDPEPVEPIIIPVTSKIGDTLTGLAPFTDGDHHDYAALVLRGPNAAVYRAVLLSTVDTSGAAALRDVTRTLPIVILATVLVGAPMAVLLSRSVARPLDRLRGRLGLVDPLRPPPSRSGSGARVRDLTERSDCWRSSSRGQRPRAGRAARRTPLIIGGRGGPGRRHRDRRARGPAAASSRRGRRLGDWSAGSARRGPDRHRHAHSAAPRAARSSRPRSSGSRRRPRRPA
jgi:hypothetical protein